MRRVQKTVLLFFFANSALFGGENCVVLNYGDFDEAANKIAVLEVPLSKIQALKRVATDDEFRVSPIELFAAAKRALDLSGKSFVQIGREWLFQPEPEKIKQADPLGNFEPLVSDFKWRVVASTLREIDLGRSRESPWVWKQESSGRYWWEVRLRGFDNQNQSAAEIVVFLLQDYSVISPHFVTASETELIQIKKAKASAKRDL
ncbi:MAG: hypothetical protein HS117_04835 [Verrucomicrobiaceae bacterium]|nr:hypothetical protein [Verrucomicrobiaceae bacterium]